jgi:hypothetical protein
MNLVHDLSILRQTSYADAGEGTFFIYAGELTTRFTFAETHDCWVQLTGQRAFQIHEIARGNRTDAAVTLLTGPLALRANPRSAAVPRNRIDGSLEGYALVTRNGLAIGASFHNDQDEGRDLGRIGVSLVGGPIDFHDNAFTLAWPQWDLQWFDSANRIVLSVTNAQQE